MNKFITILLTITFNFSSFALAESMVNARTAIVIDYHSDKVLYEYEPDIQILDSEIGKIKINKTISNKYLIVLTLNKYNLTSLNKKFYIKVR